MSDKVETVRMRRDEPPFPGGPVTADVHPDEEANYVAAGWLRDESEARAREEAAAAEAVARARADAEAQARADAEAAAKLEAEAKAKAEAEAAKAQAAESAPVDAGGSDRTELPADLEEMKRPQLAVVAEKYGVTILPGMSNVAVVAAIRAAAGYTPQGEGSEGSQQ